MTVAHAGAFAGLDPCVHCGFCLPACPTYEVTADEADSPRGRIVLMRALVRGHIAPSDPGLQHHLDRCLGCRGCESVCPAGVLFGPALEASRDVIAKVRPIPWMLRAALWMLARPPRQRWFWLLSRLLRASGLPRFVAKNAGRDAPTVARMLAMLAATESHLSPSPLPRLSPSHLPLAPVLFRGCVMDGLFGHVHDATIAALAHNECAVVEAPGQVCCGALAAHAGAHEFAKALARENVAAFAKTAGDIVVNSAGCGAMLKSYGDLLAGEPMEAEAREVAARVRDVSEVLAERGPKPGTRALPLRIAYDAPCHLIHAQRITAPPLRLLAAIPGLALVPLAGADRCCGSAGLYSMIEPDMSREVLGAKLDAIRDAAPDIVATGNPGCLMHIGAGIVLDGQPVAVAHPVELLAWSYRS